MEKTLKLVRVQESYGANPAVFCVRCYTKHLINKCWADLNGKPFIDYYCEKCFKQIKEG